MSGNERSLGAEAAELVDRAADDRVLVFGSLPPSGRDLDLLVRPREEVAIAAALERAGYRRRGRHLAVFRSCTAFGVELVPVSALGLPPVEVDELYDRAQPLAGLTALVQPAPHHMLLLIARRIVWGDGELGPKLRSRIATALAGQPSAWADAQAHASAWRARQALVLLRAAYGDAPASRGLRMGARRELAAGPRELLRAAASALPVRPRRPLVVGLSGLDGSGKSSQAAALKATLAELGVDAAAEWSPLGGNLLLDAIAVPSKTLMRRVRFGPLAKAAGRVESTGHVMSSPNDDSRRGAGRFLTTVWGTLVITLNLLAQRRAVVRHGLAGRRVVVFDRHVLDSIVRLRFLYAPAAESSLQRWLANAVAPKASIAYLLDVRPETALARKPDEWTLGQLQRQAELYRDHAERLGIRRLDGELPREQLCSNIATEVWRVLR